VHSEVAKVVKEFSGIEQKLEEWKRALLLIDGNRSNLISFRPSPTGVLHLVDPDPEILYSSLQSGGTLTIPLPDEGSTDLDLLDPAFAEDAHTDTVPLLTGPDAPPTKQRRDRVICTDADPKKLESILYRLRLRAKNALDERGVNVLYVAFGLLRWKETSGASEIITSPVVLVPVELQRRSPNDPYTLRMRDDDTVVNPVLVEKLRNEFGIGLSLPGDDPRELELSDILDVASRAIEAQRQWEVDRDAAYLGIFSFLKLSMYKELETFGHLAARHPLVRRLAGDSSATLFTPRGVPSASELDDRVPPSECFEILDADASQLEAIVRAKAGATMIIQGPPGTGKSQTIANIIAEFLAAGKKILFVSEKVAALDVVYKRLDQAGLRPFCLLAHSHKMNRRDAVAQLRDALNHHLSNVRSGASEHTELYHLATARTRLNDYVRALHNAGNPLHRSVFQILGEIAHRQDTPRLVFSFNGAADLTQERLAQLEECVRDLRGLADTFLAAESHPWYGCSAESASLQQRNEIAHRFEQLHRDLATLADTANQVAPQVGLGRVTTIEQARAIHRFLERLPDTRLSTEACLGLSEGQGVFEVARELENRLSSGDADKHRARYFARCMSLLYSIGHAPVTDARPASDVDAERKSILESLRSLAAGAERLGRIQADMVSRLGLGRPGPLRTLPSLLELAALILTGPRAEATWFDRAQLSVVSETSRLARDHANRVKTEGAEILGRFAPDVFDVAAAMLRRFTEDYASFLRFLRADYRRDLATLNHLAKDHRKLSYSETVAELKQIAGVAASRSWLRDHENVLAEQLGSHYLGDDTDWDEVTHALEWTRAVIDAFAGQAVPPAVVELAACSERTRECLLSMLEEMRRLVDGVGANLADLSKLLPVPASSLETLHLPDLASFARNVYAELEGMWQAERRIREISESGGAVAFYQSLGRVEDGVTFVGKLFPLHQLLIGGSAIDKASFDGLCSWLAVRRERIEDLDDWIHYRAVERRCRSVGLSSFMDALRGCSAPPEGWADILLRHVYEMWLDAQCEKEPVLAEFRGESHESIIRRFRELDRKAVQLAASRVRNALLERMPRLDQSWSDRSEVGILRHEISKSKRYKSIRRLFCEIPTLLQILKPCLMMSPLSLSQYLDPERIRFDVVIFDEASQIRAVDAIGAIMRADQVIIAGDEHQLPPTDFFATLGTDSADDLDGNAGDVYESILDACYAAQVPDTMLRWHYRSRDEGLIAFSNQLIYQGQLVTFPGPWSEEPGRGVSFEYIEGGVYDRARTRTNQIEAARVADLVMEHADRFVHHGLKQSLGVVAFSEAQMLAIEQELYKRRRARPDLEPFFAEDDSNNENREPFFVKNLESVQGDERDVIFFSVGYGRDASGRITMNFGPLNRAGGERRLNVAITRARYRVRVVSSIRADDLAVRDTTPEGVRLLKLYLEYAERGVGVLSKAAPSTGPDYESVFERAVAEALERQGLTIIPQVGCARFRIDLGVLHPTKPGRFVLGIECDGATYHRTATARDRDRLRQEMLEGLGWRIHRIWSRDWVRSPVREIQRVMEAYRQALEEEETTRPSTAASASPLSSVSPTRQSSPRVVPVPRPTAPEPSVAPYRPWQPPRAGPREQFYLAPKDALVDRIRDCVNAEGPVSLQVVRQRVAACWEIQRVGSKVSTKIDFAIKDAVKRHLVVRKGDFLWPRDMDHPPIRAAGEGENARLIRDVCPEEIREAVLLALKTDIAFPRDELILQTARILGYERAGAVVSKRIEQAVDGLEAEGAILSQSGHVTLLSGLNGRHASA
jgi:very-short-patch-repair endonuclease/DNA polymerase III delta prime subunit